MVLVTQCYKAQLQSFITTKKYVYVCLVYGQWVCTNYLGNRLLINIFPFLDDTSGPSNSSHGDNTSGPNTVDVIKAQLQSGTKNQLDYRYYLLLYLGLDEWIAHPSYDGTHCARKRHEEAYRKWTPLTFFGFSIRRDHHCRFNLKAVPVSMTILFHEVIPRKPPEWMKQGLAI